MHHQVKQIKSVADKEKLDFDYLIEKLQQKKNLLAASPSIKPVPGVITSPFGYRKSPFTGRRTFHSGLDISNRMGTKIVSTATGKVVFAGRKSGYGNVIIIDHGYGKATKYAHLRDILVKKNQHVKRGEAIATLGNTGRTTGPHLTMRFLSTAPCQSCKIYPQLTASSYILFYPQKRIRAHPEKWARIIFFLLFPGRMLICCTDKLK